MKHSTAFATNNSSAAAVEPHIRQRIEDFLNDYCHSLDDGRIDEWTGYFADEASYSLTTRENFEAGYPLGVMYCEGRGMMEDRIRAMQTANIYEPHVYCHLLGRPRLWAEGQDLYGARSNFTVYRTMQSGQAEVFATGKYLDMISCASGAPLFVRRQVILDSRRIDTLLVCPL